MGVMATMNFARRCLPLALLALGALVVDSGRAAPAPRPPTIGPLISGRSSYAAGTYVWTDYAYDDRGADTNDQPGGDVTYPGDMTPNNVADLIQLQLTPLSGNRMRITVVLETLTTTSQPLVGVAFDSDANAATGAATLPGSWTAAGLGVDQLVLLGRASTALRSWSAGAWQSAGSSKSSTDLTANTVSAVVPYRLRGDRLRAVAAVGYDDGDGGSWATGASPVHDLAFVVAEKPVTPYLQGVTDAVTGFASSGEKQWQEFRQSAILAGTADAAPAVATIDMTKLQRQVSEFAKANTRGFHTFLYRSRLSLGEGIAGAGNAAWYNGPYQPYLVWVPGPMRPGRPLVLYLHGSSQTHLSAVNTGPYDADSGDSHIYSFDAVVAWPLGRGPQTWYEGPALQDPLDVADDVIARLALDPERVMLAGLSMGGYGTFKLGSLMPDRWSLAYVDVAADDTGLPENFTALPVRFQNGAADPLIAIGELFDYQDLPPRRTRALFDAAGSVDYRSWFVAGETHAPATALAECVYRLGISKPRVKNPPRVRYTVDTTKFVVDKATGQQLRFDRAYWVSGIKTRGPKGSVDLTTQALGRIPVPGETTETFHENSSTGRDFCGPSAVSTGDLWSEQGRIVALVSRPAVRRLTGTLGSVTALTIAADRAGLGGRGTGVLALTSDSPATLTLTGLRPGARVSVGRTITQARGDGKATVHLGAGLNEVKVT